MLIPFIVKVSILGYFTLCSYLLHFSYKIYIIISILYIIYNVYMYRNKGSLGLYTAQIIYRGGPQL